MHAIRKHTEETHAAVLALLDELLEMGRREEAPALELVQGSTDRPLAAAS